MMTREEVFKATGPTSGSSMWVKIGVTKDGKIIAAEGVFKFQAGAFPGSPVMNGCLCAFAPYDIANARTVGYDVVCNRPKSAAYRAPGSPISAFAVESVIDMLAQEDRHGPAANCGCKNAARTGTPMIYGPKLAHGGYAETLEALQNHPGYKAPLGQEPGPRRRVAATGSTAAANRARPCRSTPTAPSLVATGSPDIGGSRASMAMMAAETLGVDYNQVRAIVADTASVGYTHVTGGSRVTFATGMAVVDAAKNVIEDMCARAAMIWGVDPEGVIWEDGHAKPAGSNVGDFEPMSLQGDRRQGGADRRADRRPPSVECRRPGARLRDPVLRCRGRSGDRQGDDPALRRRAGCRQGDPPELCRGADPGRRRAGHRLGAQRGVHLRRQGPAAITPASSTTAARSPPTCR